MKRERREDGEERRVIAHTRLAGVQCFQVSTLQLRLSASVLAAYQARYQC